MATLAQQQQQFPKQQQFPQQQQQQQQQQFPQHQTSFGVPVIQALLPPSDVTVASGPTTRLQYQPLIVEHIQPSERIEIRPIVNRERVVEEVQPVIQTVTEQVIVPQTALEQQLPAERREIQAAGEVAAPAWRPMLPSRDVGPVQRQVTVQPPVVHETLIRKVIEEVQPVVHRNVIQNTLVRTVKPIYEHVIENRVYRPVVQVNAGAGLLPAAAQPAFFQQPWQQGLGGQQPGMGMPAQGGIQQTAMAQGGIQQPWQQRGAQPSSFVGQQQPWTGEQPSTLLGGYASPQAMQGAGQQVMPEQGQFWQQGGAQPSSLLGQRQPWAGQAQAQPAYFGGQGLQQQGMMGQGGFGQGGLAQGGLAQGGLQQHPTATSQAMQGAGQQVMPEQGQFWQQGGAQPSSLLGQQQPWSGQAQAQPAFFGGQGLQQQGMMGQGGFGQGGPQQQPTSQALQGAAQQGQGPSVGATDLKQAAKKDVQQREWFESGRNV